nr:APC family permease [Streptomyces sp. TLI_235]
MSPGCCWPWRCCRGRPSRLPLGGTLRQGPHHSPGCPGCYGGGLRPCCRCAPRTAAFPIVSFAPETITAGSVGIGLMIAFSGFAGYESAVLYGEEATDPTRSIPRAAYLAVGAIGLVFVATSWITIGAIGADQAQTRARTELGNLMFGLVDTYASKSLSQAMAVLMCVALLASILAMHNAASRYTFALGRERLLPAVLGRFDSRRFSPANASLAQTAVTTLVIAAFAAAGLDPYLNLATSMVGLSTLGILVVQAIAAVAIVVYFHRNPEPGLWRTRVAPLSGRWACSPSPYCPSSTTAASAARATLSSTRSPSCSVWRSSAAPASDCG